ncbi:MAG: GGDEF domain-containing protein [Ruminococcaceae bacterium]|nr:GGDEF domain-containing protein [Oscillospiraceae bacterium]
MKGKGNEKEELAMPTCKKPIRRSMMLYGILFIVVLAVLMSIQSAGVLKASIDELNYTHMKSIVTYVEHTTDADDLRECIRTLTPSEKYVELQERLNTMVNDFNVRFIYISIPSVEQTALLSVCTSTSDEEIERAGQDFDYPLMYPDEDITTYDELLPFVEAWGKVGQFSSFKSNSDWLGACYTVSKPLQASDGEVVALISVDMDLATMHSEYSTFLVGSILMIAIISFVFSVTVSIWLKKSVTTPLLLLEKSTRGLAEKSHANASPDELVFEKPNIRTENEIQSLSDSIEKMAEDMKAYVKGLLSAEKRADAAEEAVEDVTRFANQDALTGAHSKVAYDAMKAEYSEKIAATGGDVEFAVVVVDLNNLKRINDIYGLERGNKYIVAGCEVVRNVFPDTPIYRVGSDTFVVMLTGEMYRDRDELYEVLVEQLLKAQEDTEREPWERCSGAAGMTEFFRGADADVDQVFRRAEMIMTRNKRIMKKNYPDI